MRLVLCRHAEAGNSEQAEALAHALAAVTVDAVYTSPLARAVATADAVAAVHGLKPVVSAGLREIELGDVDGLQFEEYPQQLQDQLLQSPATVRFPGGESYEQLRVRVVAILDELLAGHGDETIVVVSHAGANRAALATWLGVEGDAAFRLDQSFAAVNVVDWTDGKPFVRLVNGATMPAALRAAL
jgi:broad specificity phosphatase PhoE